MTIQSDIQFLGVLFHLLSYTLLVYTIPETLAFLNSLKCLNYNSQLDNLYSELLDHFPYP